MYKYVIKRLLMMIPVIIGISFIIFLIMSLTPGTPGDVILGSMATPEAIQEMNEELGFYDPFLVRYVSYVKEVCQGDFGASYRTGLPVVEEIAARFPVTLKLALFSTVLAILLGIPIGILSAVKQYSLVDNVSTVFALAFMSMPQFWLGLLLILLFSLKLGILPPSGSDSLLHFLLPSFTACASLLATIIRMTRSTMLEVIRQDYTRTAYAKGADKRRVIFHHCLKNALIPIVTVIGVNFGSLLGGAIIVEAVFGMSGIGNLMLTGIRTKDLPIVMGCVLLLAVVFSLINLVVDIIYAYLDPRIKAQYSNS